MRSLLARLVALGAFSLTVSACGSSGAALSFAGPPNNAGGVPGNFQSGSNGLALLRFVQGSPDKFFISFGSGPTTTAVDICVDNGPFGGGALVPSADYGQAAHGSTGNQATLYGIASGIAHTVTVYPAIPATSSPGGGAECVTAPGPYFGTSPIANVTITPANNSRVTVVLGGTAAAATLGLYAFSEPLFPTGATTPLAISHNAAPNFSASAADPNHGVGFGQNPTPAGPPVTLTGASNVALATKSAAFNETVSCVPPLANCNRTVTSTLTSVPASFVAGPGVLAGAVSPLVTVPTPAVLGGQGNVYQLYAIDGTGPGGLNLVVVPESTNGFGF